MEINFEKTIEIPKNEAKKILEKMYFNDSYRLANKFFLDELEREFTKKDYVLSWEDKYPNILKISSPQKAQLRVYSNFNGGRFGGLMSLISRKYNLPPTSVSTAGYIIFEKKGEDQEKMNSILENLGYKTNVITDEQEKRAEEDARLTRIIEETINRSRPKEMGIAELLGY